MIALRDRTAPSVFAALDVMLRRLGGAPTYLLTDNEKTVTVDHIAGMAVRNPQNVSFASHYGVTVHTCEPADPASKGGSENTVKQRFTILRWIPRPRLTELAGIGGAPHNNRAGAASLPMRAAGVAPGRGLGQLLWRLICFPQQFSTCVSSVQAQPCS